MEENTSKVYTQTANAAVAQSLASNPESGTPLFVINLCASNAPVPLVGKTLPGFENFRLYQMARAEDGRTRHRLRLGFFASEAEAEGVLATIREQYPTAFTTCLGDDDRRFTRGYLPKAAAAEPRRPVPTTDIDPIQQMLAALEPPTPRAAAQPKAAVAAKSAPLPAKPVAAPKIVAAAPAPAQAAPAAKAASSGPIATQVETKPATAPTSSLEQPSVKTQPSAESYEIELNWDHPAPEPAHNASASKTPGTASGTAPQVVPAASEKAQGLKAKAAPPSPLNGTEPSGTEAPKAEAPVVTAKAAAKPAPMSASSMMDKIELMLAADPVMPPRPTAEQGDPSQPFHVGKGAEIPAVAFSLFNDQPAAMTAASAVAQSTTGKNTAPAARIPNGVTAKPGLPGVAADLDTTQTIRALTTAELNDESQDKWFAIQLAVSEQPLNLDAMPHLDIFEAYRLYSVASAGSGKIIHSLRLGFFREAVSAEAVSGYLKTFFPNPSVLRISMAEQTRFKDSLLPRSSSPLKTPAGHAHTSAHTSNQASTHAAGPANTTRIVDLNARVAPKGSVPTVTMEVPTLREDSKVDASATGSFRLNGTGAHKKLSPSLKATPAPARRPSDTKPKTANASANATGKFNMTGKFKATAQKSLAEQLMDEARQVQLSESAIRKLPKNDSLLSRLVGKLTK